ncbi:DNA-binding transcription factor yap1 [Penicillium lagena]|uniref:DNA-binding transcription factor yap1 n=1 Tax=Penicillium lagena TaxID=94218 RepID=UPI002540EF8E|nr:DNA-binding transcription factor yap1 [Penicillium lagena]KAJ5612135.1 DNA-binding transcription factor yap1 [Penicillium lagena]
MQGGDPQSGYKKEDHSSDASSLDPSPQVSSEFNEAFSHSNAVGFGGHRPRMHSFSIWKSFERHNPEDRLSGPPGSSAVAKVYEPGKKRKFKERMQNVENERSRTKRLEGEGKESSNKLLILRSEPNMKRRAQNRASQRAFRERKVKHLQDLQRKIDELQESSDFLGQENSLLRARVWQLEVEARAQGVQTSEYVRGFQQFDDLSGEILFNLYNLHPCTSKDVSGALFFGIHSIDALLEKGE